MPQKRPLLRVVGRPPLNSPLTVPQFQTQNPLAATAGAILDPGYQRWFLEVYRDLLALLGADQDGPVSLMVGAATVDYRWRSVIRLSIPQAAVGPLAAKLGDSSIGLLVCVTDYNHILEWDGTKFQWGPGEMGSNWFATGAPSAPGWRLCDGSGAVPYLNSDGTLANQDLPDNPGLWFRQ